MSTKTTTDLRTGDKVTVPATLNSRAYTATVIEAAKPWILTAGPKAGQQAKSKSPETKGAPLFTIRLGDVEVHGDHPRGMSENDLTHDTATTRSPASPADYTWTVTN